ncbi:cytochrome P450 [Actinobacteria bacterium OV450]|nr:cytochrome P450 [Actinobacteria bacterium OV450]
MTAHHDTEHSDPLILDPLMRDYEEENARLRAAGPLAAVLLPGGIPAWAVTRHAEATQLLADPRLVKDVNCWAAWQRGEIPNDWPQIGLADHGRSMFSTDGLHHRRLRSPIAKALTARCVERMRPRILHMATTLLDALPADGQPVDLRAAFAYPLPMNVISELVGVSPAYRPRLRPLFERFLSTQTPPEQVDANQRELTAAMHSLAAEHRTHSADDLTCALLSSHEGGRFTEEEVVHTLQLIIGSGFVTTVSLIVNAVVNLSTHPDQLALVRSQAVSWNAVVEETLRYTAPNSNFLIRFASEDIPVGGTTLPRGEALIVSYGAIGRDELQHGPTAQQFDITRAPRQHISFGYGPHVCVAAALARLEGRIALSALYNRFPELTLAVPAAQLRHLPSITQNDLYELPVLLDPLRCPEVSGQWSNRMVLTGNEERSSGTTK